MAPICIGAKYFHYTINYYGIRGTTSLGRFHFSEWQNASKKKILISTEKVLGSMAGNLGKALGFGDPRFEAL